MASRMRPAGSAIPLEARALGHAAALPLLVLAVIAWLAEAGEGVAFSIGLVRTYGAVSISFLGGVRLGAALESAAGRERLRRFALAALPPALAWLALLPGPVVGLGLLVCGFLVQCLWDVISADRGRLPAWYAALRVEVTAVAIACLIAVLARTVLA